MKYSNVEILSAVVAKWAQPLITAIAQDNIGRIPFIANIEEKIKGSGWVGAKWSIVNELSPFIPSVTNAIVSPMIQKVVGNVSDEQIPALAFGIVDNAISKGSLELLDGKITFDKDDLKRLRTLLKLNLPLPTDTYQVIERDER